MSYSQKIEKHNLNKYILLSMLILCIVGFLAACLGPFAGRKAWAVSMASLFQPKSNQGAPSESTPGSTNAQKFIFGDEFNGSALDAKQWNIEDYGQGGYKNSSLSQGLQYYTPKALTVRNGTLNIVSKQQRMGDSNYTSGALTTEHTFSFRYGRVDIRARLPKGKGIWPAFWMLTANADHEIDIMEMVNKPTSVYQTYHLHTPAVNTYVSQGIVKGQDFSAAFHTYSLLWSASAIGWYIDGMQTFEVTKSVPHKPMYLLFNTAIGGEWPGAPDAHTSFPQTTAIDYVRVYQ